jgi:hypothetical protein
MLVVNWCLFWGGLMLLFQDIENEAKAKGYTREELEHEIEVVREKLMKDLYK